MALEYRLVLAGDAPVNQVAERALPEPGERPTGTPPVLAADLFERYGFELTVRAGRHGYVDAESDDGSWEWEPDPFVSVGFHMDKFADPAWQVINMLTVVRRVLHTGAEDAALTFNGDILLLTRFDGTPIRHHASWWSHHPAADQLI